MATDLRGLNTDKKEESGLKFESITKEIIGAAFEVHRVLGYGFLEKVYQRAMQVELIQKGLKAELEFPIKVQFKGTVVGCESKGWYLKAYLGKNFFPQNFGSSAESVGHPGLR